VYNFAETSVLDFLEKPEYGLKLDLVRLLGSSLYLRTAARRCFYSNSQVSKLIIAAALPRSKSTKYHHKYF